MQPAAWLIHREVLPLHTAVAATCIVPPLAEGPRLPAARFGGKGLAALSATVGIFLSPLRSYLAARAAIRLRWRDV
eukprot:930452-Alexandrium_andersonii.AAC.1